MKLYCQNVKKNNIDYLKRVTTATYKDNYISFKLHVFKFVYRIVVMFAQT